MTESVPARASTHVDLVPYDHRWPQRFARTTRDLIKQDLAVRFADHRAEYIGQKALYVDALMRRVHEAHGKGE